MYVEHATSCGDTDIDKKNVRNLSTNCWRAKFSCTSNIAHLTHGRWGQWRMDESEIHVSSSNTSGERWKIICFSHSADIIINQSFFSPKKKHFKQFKNNYVCRVAEHFVHMPCVFGQLTKCVWCMLQMEFVGICFVLFFFCLIYSFVQCFCDTKNHDNRYAQPNTFTYLCSEKNRNVTNKHDIHS